MLVIENVLLTEAKLGLNKPLFHLTSQCGYDKKNKFIELYWDCSLLLDSTVSQHKNKNKRNDGLMEIAVSFFVKKLAIEWLEKYWGRCWWSKNKKTMRVFLYLLQSTLTLPSYALVELVHPRHICSNITKVCLIHHNFIVYQQIFKIVVVFFCHELLCLLQPVLVNKS